MSLIEAPPPLPRTFSQVLEALGEGDDSLTLGEVVRAFGDRGVGALILVLSLMALIPWPPGGKALFAIPIILLSIELAVLRRDVWLPRWALKASLNRATYRVAIGKVIKPIRFVENLSRPRLTVLTGPISEVVIGVVCVFLAMVMALPIPFGDALPGFALVFFALGVMQRDGWAILLGALGTVLTAGYLVVIWATVVEIAQHVAGWAAHLA